MPKQTTRPQRPPSWPDYAPDQPKRPPARAKNPWPILVVIMLVLGVVFGGLGFVGLRYMQNQSAAPVQKDAEAATSVKSVRAATTQPTGTALGKVARDGDFAFKVNRISTGASQTFVYVVVKNVSAKPQTLVPSIQQVRGSGDRTYPAYAAAASARSKRLWSEIPAGRARGGVMVFPAGTTAKPTGVELHGQIGSTGILVSR